jgi:hypothetical protein
MNVWFDSVPPQGLVSATHACQRGQAHNAPAARLHLEAPCASSSRGISGSGLSASAHGGLSSDGRERGPPRTVVLVLQWTEHRTSTKHLERPGARGKQKTADLSARCGEAEVRGTPVLEEWACPFAEKDLFKAKRNKRRIHKHHQYQVCRSPPVCTHVRVGLASS